jgi:hypothetical protein
MTKQPTGPNVVATDDGGPSVATAGRDNGQITRSLNEFASSVSGIPAVTLKDRPGPAAAQARRLAVDLLNTGCDD